MDLKELKVKPYEGLIIVPKTIITNVQRIYPQRVVRFVVDKHLARYFINDNNVVYTTPDGKQEERKIS